MQLKEIPSVGYIPHFEVTALDCPFCKHTVMTPQHKQATYHHDNCDEGSIYFLNGFALEGVGDYLATEVTVPRKTELPKTLNFESPLCKL